jgi:ribosome-associated protein
VGSDAKAVIEAGEVKVNGRADTRRGRQLHHGDVVVYGDRSARVVSDMKQERRNRTMP